MWVGTCISPLFYRDALWKIIRMIPVPIRKIRSLRPEKIPSKVLISLRIQRSEFVIVYLVKSHLGGQIDSGLAFLSAFGGDQDDSGSCLRAKNRGGTCVL